MSYFLYIINLLKELGESIIEDAFNDPLNFLRELGLSMLAALIVAIFLGIDNINFDDDEPSESSKSPVPPPPPSEDSYSSPVNPLDWWGIPLNWSFQPTPLT